MNYYDIVNQDEYHIKLKILDNIEDAGEDFMSSAEVKEAGLKIWSHGGTHYFAKKIEKELLAIVKSIKPGKKSAIIQNENLLAMMKDSCNSSSDFLKNTRRVGNRLFYYPSGVEKAVRTTPAYTHWKDLSWACLAVVEEKYSTQILNCNMNDTGRIGLIDMFKVLVNWEEVEARLMKHEDEEDIKWMKVMWEDTTTVPLPKR